MTVLAVFMLCLAVAFSGCGGGGGSSNTSETTHPTVLATDPADNSTGVAVNLTRVSATFSEEMDASTHQRCGVYARRRSNGNRFL